MSEQNVEERIRAKAHAIWESEGRPEGQEDRHWQMATQMIADDSLANDETHGVAGFAWRPKADGLNPIQGSCDASESQVSGSISREKRPLD